MENKFQRILENLEEEETLMVGDQTFLNEMILDESTQCSILGTLTFFGKPDNVLNCSYDSPLKTSHQGNPVTLCDDYLYDFENIRNKAETPLLMQAVLNGAEQAGYMDGIIFLNYE